MPNLGNTPKKKKFTSTSTREGEGASAPEEEKAKPKGKGSAPAPGAARRAPTKPPLTRTTTTLLDDDDDDIDDDDEIIQASLDASKGKKMDPKIVGLICVGVAVLVVMLFLMFGGKKEAPPAPVETTPEPVVTEPDEKFGDPSLGIQDFTQDTNMNSSTPLTDPDGFVEDLHGLTTRVDYTVTEIQSNVVDFVNYTKKRGTWGGGMELYYLDCTYKDNHYVIQVPFRYYKELDDTGIVPVRMEVLFVKEANGDTLSIVSYMCLDSSVLQTVLKSQK